MRALVLGCGKSGKAAEALLKARGAEVVVLSDDARDGIGEDSVDFAVVSPGIPLAHPWIVEAKRRGIPLKSELQLGCEELKRRGWKLLAVTGSKGKSSVVKVVADALNLSGRQAVACGNYGLPVCEVVLGCGDRNVAAPAGGAAEVGERSSASETAEGRAFLSPQDRWAVVEVSSFMMETTALAPDAFEAAAILNLQEDHLDRHGSVEVYHGLKRKLLSMAKRGLEPAATGMAPPRADETDAGVDACRTAESLWAGSYFDNEILKGNAVIATGLMRAAGLDDRRIAQAFRDFVPLPHRMNLIAETHGVRYIDDSKATSLAALVAGVKMASSSSRPSVRLIAGGLPKGDDPKSAAPTLTERVKKVYLIGESAETFFAAWKGAVDCEICGTMDRAVEKVLREAERGETVLLSPGTASFDQFRSYGERGDVFADLVKRESKSK